jgi:hypothetical protein
MYVVEDGIVMPNKKAAIERGRAMVAAGRPRREVAIEIYGECYVVTNVQSSTYQRRLRDLVGRLA